MTIELTRSFWMDIVCVIAICLVIVAFLWCLVGLFVPSLGELPSCLIKARKVSRSGVASEWEDCSILYTPSPYVRAAKVYGVRHEVREETRLLCGDRGPEQKYRWCRFVPN